MKTAVLYARYSSDIQKDASIEDQFALLRAYAAREGIAVVGEYCDRAKSSATLFDRPGVLSLMAESKSGRFEAILVECIDRVSRNLADLALVYQKLQYAKIDVISASEGVATDITIGLRGIMGQMFLKDLAAKVKRGHDGRVRKGLIPGSVAYGYRRVPGSPGERVIDGTEADVIRRIFAEYADGVLPIDIVVGLHRDGIPAPKGPHWNHQRIVGGNVGGMIGNRLYIGELVWNKHHEVRDPETHKEHRRKSPAEGILTVPVPHLRIVPQPLWDAAQKVRMGRAVHRFGPNGRPVRSPTTGPRNRHLLSGLLRCATCGGHMIVKGNKRGLTYVVCAAGNGRRCAHVKIYDIDKLARGVIAGLMQKLADPARIAEAAEAAMAERRELEKRTRGERKEAERRIGTLTVARDRLVSAITDSDEPVPVLMQKLNAIEKERVGLEERLRLLSAETNVVALHPGFEEEYRKTVARMHDALLANPDAVEARVGFRNLVEAVVVHPTKRGEKYEFSVYGRHAAVAGIDLFPNIRSSEEIVLAEGLGDATIPALPRIAAERQAVFIGRFAA